MYRFLQYSKERNRAIRLMYMDETGALKQVTAVVTAFDDKQVSLYVLRPPRNIALPLDALLSADYTKGDEGQE